MISVTISDHVQFIAFWLCFTRWITVLMQLPIFDHLAVPNIVKVLTSVMIAWAFFPITQAVLREEIMAVGMNNIWFLTMLHGVIGLTLGFLVKSLMSLFISTGTLVTQQVGFSSVNYFDPSQGSQIGPFEKIIQWTLLILLLTSGALSPMFKGVVNSFFSINVMHLEKLALAPQFFTDFFKSIFSSSILLAGPLLFANLMMNLVFGIVARSIPQLNVLMVSFVVNIGMGLLLFLAISNEFFQVSFELYLEKLGEWFLFLK